ncbi:MAG: agmatine deiminase family protein [Crocinitomix sp.]|nr:agmatine deiminase family protein [Crocinitomix sp.]
MKLSLSSIIAITLGMIVLSCKKPDLSAEGTYTMPSEETVHEGTWLQWPHDHTYANHIARHDATFIEITRALHTGERVHIIAFDETEKERITSILIAEGMDMTQIDLFICETDDYWTRDNGPIFVLDQNGTPTIQNWGFNGWGDKTAFEKCNQVPNKIAASYGIPSINVDFINEGGSVELDGHGTLLAKKSSILNGNRNPGISQKEAEAVFTKYLGVTNFIWLKGYKGGDITDDHIDGTARFVNGNTIVTLREEDAYAGEYKALKNATNANGETYTIVGLPFSQNTLPGSKEKGIYVNFYIGNEVVLVPNFDDPNDTVANEIIQGLFPDKTVIGISAIELGIDGGGIHCVTQQQPLF